MSFLEGNLAALRGRFPPLADMLAESRPDPRLRVEPSRSGAPSAALGALSLHSRYDPANEAARQSASLPEAASACVFYGLGLGYLPRAFLRGQPESVAVIVEPDIGLLRAAAESVDLSDLLADERVSILVGARPEALVQALDDLGAERPARLPLKAYQEAYPDYFAACDLAIKRYEAKRQINDATLRRFGTLWVRNLARNLRWMARAPGIARLEGRFRGTPALVIAAGPSLDGVLPFLPELARSHLVIAVDTAARSVQRSGVDPDFCVVVDPQYWNVRHLDGFDASRSILVTESAVHPAVLRREWRAVYLCSSVFPLGRFMEDRVGELGKLGAGGSVATSAWDFARHLGASPVLMAGLDLGFPGKATHSRDSYFEARALMRGHRLAPAELASFQAFRAAEPYRAPDNSGGEVHTDRRMALYSWWFEARLLRPEAAKTFNLSRKGLRIAGMPYAPLADFLPAAAPARERLDAALEELAGARADPKLDFDAAFRTLLESLGSLGKAASRAVKESESAIEKARAGKGAAGELDRLSGIDAEILGNPAKEVASFLFPSLGRIAGGKPESLEKVLENGLFLYREAAAQAEYHLNILEKRSQRGDLGKK